MKIITYQSLEDFQPWNGAVWAFNRVLDAGEMDNLEAILGDICPNGMIDNEINDLFWFDSKWIFETLGMRTEEQIREEIKELKEKLIEMEYECGHDALEEAAEEINANRELAGLNELDDEEMSALSQKIWEEDYAQDAALIQEEIDELEAELGEML